MKHFTPTIIIELENITNNEHVVPGTKFTSLRPHQKGFVRIYAAELNRIKFLAGLSNNNIRPVFKLHSIDGAPVKYPQKTMDDFKKEANNILNESLKDEKDAPEPDLKDTANDEVSQPIIEIDKDVDEAKEVKDTANDEVPQPIIDGIDEDMPGRIPEAMIKKAEGADEKPKRKRSPKKKTESAKDSTPGNE